MAYQPIPETAVEIQTGLYLYEYTRTVGNRVFTFRQLFASEGYCFYDRTAEVTDGQGNVIPEDEVLPGQRLYYTWAGVAMTTDLNNYVSVPVEDGFTIASNPNQPEIA